MKKQKAEEEKHLKELNKIKAENIALKSQKAKVSQQPDQKPEKSSFKVDIDSIKQWIEQSIERMMVIRSMNKDLQNHILQRNQTLKELEDERNDYANISLEKEKIELQINKWSLKDDEGTILELEKQLEEIDVQLQAIDCNIESTESRLDFVQEKIRSIEREMADEQNREMKQFPLDNISSIDRAKTCMKAFFEIIFKVRMEKNQLEETVMDQDAKL